MINRWREVCCLWIHHLYGKRIRHAGEYFRRLWKKKVSQGFSITAYVLTSLQLAWIWVRHSFLGRCILIWDQRLKSSKCERSLRRCSSQFRSIPRVTIYLQHLRFVQFKNCIRWNISMIPCRRLLFDFVFPWNQKKLD